MKKLYFFPLLFIALGICAQDRRIPVDTIVTTNHTTKIKGKTVNYQAQTGTQPVWNTDGKPIATLFYTYYKRTDVKNGNERPLIFSFNGDRFPKRWIFHGAGVGSPILPNDEFSVCERESYPPGWSWIRKKTFPSFSSPKTDKLKVRLVFVPVSA